jgi:hypothetical protein
VTIYPSHVNFRLRICAKEKSKRGRGLSPSSQTRPATKLLCQTAQIQDLLGLARGGS